MTQYGTVELGTFQRMAKATRKVETDGTDARRGQAGHRNTGDSLSSKRYFVAILSDTDKIKIIDCFDVDNANCGQVSVNKLALAPVVVTELTITADAYIYLECVGVGDPLTSSTNTIVQYATEQSWEAGKEKQLISRVTFTGTAITDFSNEPVSSRVIIWGAC